MRRRIRKRIQFLLTVVIIISVGILPLFLSYHRKKMNQDMVNVQETFQPELLSKSPLYENEEYVIDAYNVDILVGENNALSIVETIDAYFHVPKHGIYRKIPIRNKVERLDGTTSYHTAVVSGLAVNEPYTTYQKGDTQIVEVGDPDVTLTGEKKYNIRYLYELEKEAESGYDELYFNIIGEDWDAYKGNITFSITMPKEFDASKLGFSGGSKGSDDSSGITYEIKGTVITGQCNRVLAPGEALTVRLELPEGYFSDKENGFDWEGMGIFCSVLLSVVIMIVVLVRKTPCKEKNNMDDKTTKEIEVYPPEGMNSAVIGCLNKGEADERDVISLLFYLANQGYLKITDMRRKVCFLPIICKGIRITKVKEYDGKDESIRLFWKALFLIKPTEALERRTEEVTDWEIRNHFPTSVVLEKVEETCEKHFAQKERKGSGGKCLWLIGYLLLGTAQAAFKYAGISWLIFMLIMLAMGMLFFLLISGGRLTRVTVGTFLMAGLIGVLPKIQTDIRYVYPYFIGFLCMFVISLSADMVNRKMYDTQLQERIRNFKRFLKTANQSQVKAIMKENPNYFYEMLPYAYVLGISKRWIRKGKQLSQQMPKWYAGNLYREPNVGKVMNTMLRVAENAAIIKRRYYHGEFPGKEV